MKCKYLLPALCALSLTLTGCGGSSSDKEKESETTSAVAASYHQALRQGDYEAAHASLDELYTDYCQETVGIINDDFEKKANAYYSALNTIYSSEIRMLLAENAGEVDKIVFLLSEIPQDGEKQAEGLCDYYTACFKSDEAGPMLRYKKSSSAINKLCDTTLGLAINRKNMELAKQILDFYQDEVVATKGSSHPIVVVNGVEVDGNHGYIQYTHKAKDAAQAKYNRAFGGAANDSI